MTGLEEDPSHGLDDWGEDPRDAARKQVQFLEEGIDPAATGSAASALLDEAYRAAHLLRSALDPSRSPNVIRIARQIQALVTAARKGHIPTGPGVLSLLRTAAHAAAESVEAVSRGKRETSSAGEAAAALESFLGGALAAPPVAGDESGPVRYTRVDAGRLQSARAAAAAAAASVAAFARSAEEAARAETALRLHAQKRSELAAEVLSAIPQGLAAAARGEPVTEVAQELAARISALSALDEESGDAITRLTAKIREAGDAGTHAMAAGSGALAGIDAVRLRNALHGVEAAAHGAEMHVELGDGEIVASLGPVVKSALARLIHALSGSARAKKTRTAKSGKAGAPGIVTFSMDAQSIDGREVVRLSSSGASIGAAELSEVVAAVSHPLARQKAELHIEKRRGDRVTLVLGMPSYRRAVPGEASFLVVSVKGVSWAIPSEAVVECVPAPLPAAAGWNAEAIVTLSEPGQAGAGVVVRGEKAPVVILVDALVGEETLRTAGVEDGPVAASFVTRADGTRIAVCDVPGLLSPRRAASRKARDAAPKGERPGEGPGSTSRPRASVRSRKRR